MTNKKYYSSICLIVKNDQDLLAEWIPHAQRIGFDHIYLIDNGTQPRLDGLLRNYIHSGYITYVYNSKNPYQLEGYNNILNQYRHETTWMAFIDSDEFIVLKRHRNINDFLREYENFGSVSISWYLFGSSGHLTHQESTIKSYYKRVRHGNMETGQYYYKSIVVTDHVHKVHVHNIVNYVNGYYGVDETKTRVSGASPQQLNTNIIQLNHYVIRSLEDCYNKCNRQIRNGWEKKIDYFYGTDAVANEEIDWSIIELHYPEYSSCINQKMKEDYISKNNDLSMEEIMEMLEEDNL